MSAKGKLLICPICQSGLDLIEAQDMYQCVNRHAFDVARQGYVNLLPSHLKGSKAPGDSKEMVLARREFLAKGHYEPLSDRINHLVFSTADGNGKTFGTLLDIGCGEGYYLTRLLKAQEPHKLRADAYGLDISKEAVKAAAAGEKTAVWLVGNSHFVPLQGNAFDCVLSVFSPILGSEIARLLKPLGVFLRVLPGPEHLLEMRQVIYPEVIQGPEKTAVEAFPELVFLKEETVRYPIELTADELTDLVKMTPHFWKTTKADKEKLAQFNKLTVTIDMRILVYGKNKEAQHV